MVSLSHIFVLLGALFLGTAVLDARDRRWSVAAFWTILAAPFLFGDAILAAAKAGTAWPAQAMGAGVIALGLLASRNRAGAPAGDLDHARDGARDEAAAREASAARLGNRLFLPALAIPVLTIALLRGAKYLRWNGAALIDPAQTALISLGVAATLALIIALLVTRARPIHGLGEGRRLLDTVGWAVALPMVLATLGTVFTQTGVGDAIAGVVGAVIPTDSRLACLIAYALGMIGFTAIMGNAFAAFPVMMAGLGVPLLVVRHGADPAALGAMGMLTGYCGTLLTPMAANFNVVPAVLLELRDPYGVIRAQVPTALVLIAANIILMSVFVFR
jgi:uncharacterized membrane protein